MVTEYIGVVKTKKKIITVLVLFLVSFLCACFVHACAEDLPSAFSDFISDSRWADGVYWGGRMPHISSWRAWGCCAYCCDFTKYCFGIDNPNTGEVFYNTGEIRAGDVIILGDPDDGTGHWFCVLKRVGKALYTAEGNSVEGKVRVGFNYSISSNKYFNEDTRQLTKGYHFMDSDYLGKDFYANIAASGNGQWMFVENSNGNAQLCENGNDYTDPKQQWHFVRQDDRSYRISTAEDGRYLNANQMGWAGYNVDLYSYLDWDGQRWNIIWRDNWYNIVPKYNKDLCLDVKNAVIAGGSNIQLWDRTGNAAQLFDIYKYDTHKYPLTSNLGDDFYAYIAAAGSSDRFLLENNNGNVQLCAHGNDPSAERQQWHFIRQRDGSYRIISLEDGKYLNANQMGWAGYNVDLYTYLDWQGQSWYFVKSGSAYNIVPKYNMEICLDVKDSAFAEGTNIQLWDRNGEAAQRFIITEFEYGGYVEPEPYENALTLPDNTVRIESRAFSGLSIPVNIVVTDKVKSIAADAFEGSQVIIICPGGSYAELFAIEQGIPYIIE